MIREPDDNVPISTDTPPERHTIPNSLENRIDLLIQSYKDVTESNALILQRLESLEKSVSSMRLVQNEGAPTYRSHDYGTYGYYARLDAHNRRVAADRVNQQQVIQQWQETQYTQQYGYGNF